MKRLVTITLAGCLAAVISTASDASDVKMMNGAATLPQGAVALSIDGGFDVPEPLIVGFRLDYGVMDRFQVGGSVAFWGLVGSATLHNTLNLAQSSDGTHFLSAEFDIGWLHLEGLFGGDDIECLILRPTLAYEMRIGGQKRTGIFFKAGSLDVYAGEYVSWGDALGDGDGEWANVAKFSAGVQHQFGKHFSLTLQAGLHVPSPFPVGKLGLTWAF